MGLLYRPEVIMVRALFVSVCLSVLAAAGCHVTTTSSNPARQDCYYYVEHELCPTAMYCGATYSSLSSCINYFESSGSTVLDCDTVTVEYSGLYVCENDTNYSSCGYVVDSLGFVTLPASCYGVFN
jgi:archaellum component FlaF (FlaF/FlaG flagellin family)